MYSVVLSWILDFSFSCSFSHDHRRRTDFSVLGVGLAAAGPRSLGDVNRVAAISLFCWWVRVCVKEFCV